MSIEGINTLDALKLALQALEYHQKQTRPIEMTQDTIELLKNVIKEAALDAMHENEKKLGLGFYEQAITTEESSAVQEPVAFASHGVINWIADKQFKHEADLYTHPQPKREWVGLTDEEIEDAYWQRNPSFPRFARAIEAKLKEKNG